MSWITPTGHDDPNNKYADETLAYDGETSSPAYTSENGYYLHLLHSSILCDKIRIFATIVNYIPSGTANPNVDISVYDGADWHNIFSGTITKGTWVEKSIGAKMTITIVAISFNNIGETASEGHIQEVEFGEASAVRPLIGGSLASGRKHLV